MPRFLLSALPVAAAVLLASCGGGSSKSADQQIRELDARIVDHWDHGKWSAVCDDIAPSGKAELKSEIATIDTSARSCADQVERAASLPGLAELDDKITTLTVNGDKATAPGATKNSDGTTSDDYFERIDGRWYLAGDPGAAA